MNHSERKHALLSASSSHRWLVCSSSARLEETMPDSSNPASIGGTLAYEVAKLRRMLNVPTKHPNPKSYDAEMDKHTDAYMAYIMNVIAGPHNYNVLIEERIDYSDYAPDGFGTADCIVAKGNTLHVIDFKYGRGVFVKAEDNPQIKLYALGTLKLFPGTTKIVMTIYQPRLANISSSELVVEDLLEWGKSIKYKVREAYNVDGFLRIGEHCQFCKVSTTCRTRAEENLRLAQLDFAEHHFYRIMKSKKFSRN